MSLATPEQMAALTVPATLPGVLRVGTPLLWCGEPCLYLRPTGDPIYGDSVVVSIEHTIARLVVLPECAVNLTDATGRAHVAWAVAAALGAPFPTQATFMASVTGGPPDWVCEWPETHIEDSMGCKAWAPAFVGHNINDDTRLPDGSRWVDAEALRLVALHVLGGGA
jgi:hypothetical protein